MYKCKTYRGEMRRYLNKFSTTDLLNRFERVFTDKHIRKVLIKELSNPYTFMISELEELFNNGYIK